MFIVRVGVAAHRCWAKRKTMIGVDVLGGFGHHARRNVHCVPDVQGVHGRGVSRRARPYWGQIRRCSGVLTRSARGRFARVEVARG
jgi:hypothetical protein